MSSNRGHWFKIRKPLSPARALTIKVLAFVLPVVVWAVASYVPWMWHPMVLITDVGDSVYREGDRLSRQDFADMNARLIADGSRPAQGTRANPVFLPAPHEVGMALYKAFTTPPFSKRDPWLHESLWHSLKLIFWGFFISMAVGVPLGIICGTFDLFSKLFEPFIDFIRYPPAPAFGPLMVAMFGIDEAPKIAIIVIGTFFQMVLVIANTTRLVDISLLEAAQTLGAKGPALIKRVIIPAVLPSIFRDIRILIGASWVVLIIAELTGAASGITYFITQQGKYRNYPNVYAGIIIIGLIGLFTDQFLGWLGPRLFPWTAEGARIKRGWLLAKVRQFVQFMGPSLDEKPAAHTPAAAAAVVEPRDVSAPPQVAAPNRGANVDIA